MTLLLGKHAKNLNSQVSRQQTWLQDSVNCPTHRNLPAFLC